jgi:excisionase family DNA binding protein
MDGQGDSVVMSTRSGQAKPIYSSVEDLARELGISRQKAYVELRAGRIPSIRLGRRFVIPRAAIAEWLRTAGASSPTRTFFN